MSTYCEDYPACGHTPQDPCARQWYDEPGAFDTSRPGNEHALCDHENGDCDVEPEEPDEVCDEYNLVRHGMCMAPLNEDGDCPDQLQHGDEYADLKCGEIMTWAVIWIDTNGEFYVQNFRSLEQAVTAERIANVSGLPVMMMSSREFIDKVTG